MTPWYARTFQAMLWILYMFTLPVIASAVAPSGLLGWALVWIMISITAGIVWSACFWIGKLSRGEV